MSIDVLFVRPPRYMWPFNSESSSFWQPLGFASMAAVLEEHDFKVKIIDCLPLKMGWKSLIQTIEKEKPRVLGLGDEVASANESLRLASIAKQLDSTTKVIGGGYYFSYMDEDSLLRKRFDYVVRGEGEITLLQLMNALQQKRPPIKKIDGLSYIHNSRFRRNKDRKPLANMDELPIPAYHLLPMELYGATSRNHKDFAAIEHGRGCLNSCSFCSVWKLMSHRNAPFYRTKSPERSLLETEMLLKKYKRKTLNWTDGTYNADPTWTKEYTQLLQENNLFAHHTNWMRADFIVRDEQLGILKKIVDCGLVQTVVGVERFLDKELQLLHKNIHFATAQKAFLILKKYPEVLSIASFIYGLPNDNKQTLKQLWRMEKSSFADLAFLIPFTPYPGTDWWDLYHNSIQEKDLSKYNMHMPVTGTNHLSRKQLNSWFKGVLIKSIIYPNPFLKRVLFEKNERKRKVHRSIAIKITKSVYAKIRQEIGGNLPAIEYGVKPKWYDS